MPKPYQNNTNIFLHWGSTYSYTFLIGAGDVDYTPEDTTLVFSQGVSRVCLNVAITQDEVFEDEEEIQLALATSDDGVLLTTRVATIRIMSDDCKLG